MNPILCHTGSRIHKISSTLAKVIGDRAGEGATPPVPFILQNCFFLINFSLLPIVLCFSFVEVLYSMYSLYAIINVALDERGCHV